MEALFFFKRVNEQVIWKVWQSPLKLLCCHMAEMYVENKFDCWVL